MSDKGHHIVMPKTYIVVLLSLMFFMFLTIFVAKYEPFASLHEPWNVILALAIAFTKMSLIMMFFMHVKYQSRFNQAVSVVALCWMVLFFVLTFNDYATRSTWHSPSATSLYANSEVPAAHPAEHGASHESHEK